MSEPPAPFTPEQEARIKAIVRELIPEIIQATMESLLQAIRQAKAMRPEFDLTDDGRLTYKEQAMNIQLIVDGKEIAATMLPSTYQALASAAASHPAKTSAHSDTAGTKTRTP